MPLSDRELNNVISFYTGLRKVVFIAGVVVIVAAVVAVIAGTYDIGRKDGKAEAALAPKPKPRVQAKSQEEIDAVEPEEAEEAAGPARTDLGEADANTTQSGAATPPETRPDPSAVQRPEVSAASPLPAPAVVGRKTFADAFGAPLSDTKPVFSVTVRPKKHGWARRFFGAIGRGVGKAVGVR
jgi:hypothetical protein